MINTGGFRPDPKPEKREKKKPKPIPKKTKKQAADDAKYSAEAKEWLEGRICECCWEVDAEQVHHAKGRKGYADQCALEKGIKLIHDKRFWKALCAVCHDQVERHPKYATDRGLTLTRTDILLK
jgi:hypothetical protein